MLATRRAFGALDHQVAPAIRGRIFDSRGALPVACRSTRSGSAPLSRSQQQAHYARHQLAARGAVAKLRYQAGR